MESKQKQKAKRIGIKAVTMLAVSTVIFACTYSGRKYLKNLEQEKTIKAMEESYKLSSQALEANASETVRLTNTANETYIYTAQDLVTFRNNANAGNNYSGKTVYLMNDIDLSSVCSSSLGSFGVIKTPFAGTFNR